MEAEGVFDGEYWEVDDPSSAVTVQDPPIYTTHSMGCLEQKPLRYGDIDGDGVAEIVVITDWRISISSTSKGREIFAAVWNHADEVEDRLAEEISEGNENRFMGFAYDKLGEEAPQFIAGSGTDPHALSVHPALRAFAKLYFGDFDADGAHDIVLWRKVYESNTVGNPQKGFHLKAQNQFHYERVSGLYERQDTEISIIQSWLSDRELTWPDGFPSESECEGEKGQLIPEIHDPLLNDPEVLP